MPRADAETLVKALAWVTSRLHDVPRPSEIKAVEEAAMQFDLGPLDEDWLLKHVSDRGLAPP